MRARDFAFFDAPFLAFAHRGGAAYGPNVGRENTRHAFDQAVALGYRYLETDVHATADGALVAFHDDRLDRVTEHRGLIAELSLDELDSVRIGGRDHQIPTFAELLEAYPAARFNVDAKADGSVDLLARAIADHDAYERVCVSSFSAARLRRLRRLLPGVASAASSRGVAWTRFAPALTRLVDSPAPVLQLPVRHTLGGDEDGRGGRSFRVLTPALIRAAHRGGKQVHVWTVDDRAEIDDLLDLGVDGIFTDRIDVLKDALLDRGLWTGGSR